MVDSIRNLLQIYLDLEPELQSKLSSSLIIIIVLWLIRLIARRVIYQRFQQNTRALYNWRRAIEYIVAIVGIFLVGRIWLEGIQSLATYLGLLSAGVAIALQDLLVNLAGWAFIIWRRPFVVGDRIQVGDYTGDVIDARLFEFSLLEIGNWVDAEQSTGRIIHVPNGKIFTEALANYSQGLPYIWHEMPVTITFESDWEKAKAILTQIVDQNAPEITETIRQRARRISSRFVISYSNLKPTVYTRVVSNGVLLTIRYMVDPRQRRNSEQAMWEQILRAFAQHVDIDFAYETQREYHRWQEGKAAVGSGEWGVGREVYGEGNDVE